MLGGKEERSIVEQRKVDTQYETLQVILFIHAITRITVPWIYLVMFLFFHGLLNNQPLFSDNKLLNYCKTTKSSV